MPKPMADTDRVRGSRRVKCLIQNIRHYEQLTCVYCLQPTNAPHMEHVDARANGGDAKHDDNLVISCAPCNGRKGTTNVADVFGPDVAARVAQHIADRPFTTADAQMAIDINTVATSTPETIEMVLDWVQMGFAPLR